MVLSVVVWSEWCSVQRAVRGRGERGLPPGQLAELQVPPEARCLSDGWMASGVCFGLVAAVEEAGMVSSKGAI